jgi:hypothetical protein
LVERATVVKRRKKIGKREFSVFVSRCFKPQAAQRADRLGREFKRERKALRR